MAMKHKSLSTAHRVKEIIENFDMDHIFSTQDLLQQINSIGSRNAIDLILSRLVRCKIIKRLAHGVFVKEGAVEHKITPFAVAEVKAKAFGKTIQIFGEEAAHRVGMIADALSIKKYEQIFAGGKNNNNLEFGPEQKESHSATNRIYSFYTSGCSSSFKYGDATIKFVSATPRKRELPDDTSGMVLKAVWHLGRSNKERSKIKAKYIAFNQNSEKRLEFRKYIRTVPNWLAKSLYRALA